MPLDLNKLLGFKLESYDVDYKEKDAILYSLGIGFQQDSQNTDHFKYTYELNDEFVPFPTNAVTIAHGGNLMSMFDSIPGLPEFNPMTLLHGTEDVFIEQPIKPDTKYVVQEEIKDFQDKKSGALMVIDTQIRESDTNALQSTVRTGLFIMGQGGFGHKGVVDMPKHP